MKRKVLKVGIMSSDEYRKRVLAIAAGELKPSQEDPKIWFHSIETFSRVVSSHNHELLKLIEEHNPGSLQELSDLSGRKVSNLSRTMKTLAGYGLVELRETRSQAGRKATRPVVHTTQYEVMMGVPA